MTQGIKTIYETDARRIWFAGGADLVNAFRSEHQIDAYILSVHPVLLGQDIRLFNEVGFQEYLKLVEFKKYPNGLVQLCYEPHT